MSTCAHLDRVRRLSETWGWCHVDESMAGPS